MTSTTRRRFLRGAGSLLALPALESLLPRTARAVEAVVPKRFLLYYTPNGWHMPRFVPQQAGTGFALTPTLTPLAAHRDDLVVISGLDKMSFAQHGHEEGTATFATCTPVTASTSQVQSAISVDQVIAAHVGGATPFASLQLGNHDEPPNGDNCNGYPCSYMTNISWASPTQPMPKLTSAVQVFEKLFSGARVGPVPDPAVQKRRLYRKSVLDTVWSQAKALQSTLGHTDRMKLEQYLTSVRSVEKSLAVTYTPGCPLPEAPAGGLAWEQNLHALLDLMVLAFQCDLTRVISFMNAHPLSNVFYGFLDGVTEQHHNLSHDNANPQLRIVEEWQTGLLTRLLDRLKAVQEVDGTSLLYNSLVCFASECGDGNAHSQWDVVAILAGQAGGAIETGRHLKFSGIHPWNEFVGEQPYANLMVSCLQALDVPVSTFGPTSTGPLPGLATPT